MTNSFDSIQTVFIFDSMKDAIGVVTGLIGCGFGFAIVVLGIAIALFSTNCFIDSVCKVLK